MVRQQGSSLVATMGSAIASFPIPHFSAISVPSVPAPTSPLLDPTLRAFDNDLTRRLDQLMHCTEFEASYLTLPWLSQALSTSLATNSAVEALIPAFDLPYSEREDRWVSEYMDDTAKLLDICNSLKDRISEIKDYNGQLQLILDLLDARDGLWTTEAKCQRVRNVIQDCLGGLKSRDGVQYQRPSKQLKSCNSTLRRMADKLAAPTPRRKPFISAIYAAKVNTIFVCNLLEAALTDKPRHPLISLHLPNHCVWSASLTALQQRVKDEISGKQATVSSFLLRELTCIDVVLRQLDEFLERNSVLRDRGGRWNEQGALELMALVEILTKQSAELEAGMGLLEHQVNELFHLLVNSRVALLDLISHARS